MPTAWIFEGPDQLDARTSALLIVMDLMGQSRHTLPGVRTVRGSAMPPKPLTGASQRTLPRALNVAVNSLR